jgi:hypothetical protein
MPKGKPPRKNRTARPNAVIVESEDGTEYHDRGVGLQELADAMNDMREWCEKHGLRYRYALISAIREHMRREIV